MNPIESQIELLEQPSRLVVNAHISPEAIPRISVTNSIPVTTTTFALRNVANAQVSVWEEGRLVGQAMYLPPSRPLSDTPLPFEKEFPTYYDYRAFYQLDFRPVAGKTYEIRVEAPGFAPVSTQDRIPSASPAAPTLRLVGINPTNESIAVEVALQDADTAINYYHLLFVARLSKDGSRLGTVPIRRDEGNLVETDANGIVFPAGLLSGTLLTDQALPARGRTFLLTLNGFGLINNPQEIVELQAEWRSVSKAYYDYYASLIKQERTRGDAFAQPTPIFNNVAGGLGNFSAYYPYQSDWVRLE